MQNLKIRLGSLLAALWIKSLRIRLASHTSFDKSVFGAWHKDLFASTATLKNKGIHILVSESKDGDFFAFTAQRLGFQVSRGSSSHGFANVRHLLRTLKAGGSVGMALDGPRGPAQVIKPGSIWLSKSSGRPLRQIIPKYGPHITLKTWDNFILPLPLTAIDIQIKYL